MMFVKFLFMALLAFGGGTIVSGGVVTVLIAVGLVPRFADKTHTAKHIFLYEEMIVLGTITGSFFSIYKRYGQLGNFMLRTVGIDSATWSVIGGLLLAVYGIFAGVFVGCLALAIAEMLDTIPIFTRRISLHKGIGIVICTVAVGKMIGSLLYFAYGFYK